MRIKENNMEQKYWYKWIVLAAAFFVTTFVFGLLFAFGSLLNDLFDKFNVNRSRTATVHAILIGVGLSTGVLSGILISRFGIWRMAVCGAILGPLGLILAFLATTIVHLYLFIGVITGFGISLLFISSTAAVGMSFTGSQRLLALALQNSGISLAGIVLPYCLNFLKGIYGLNGTFLILGGVNLNCLPIARIYAILEKDKAKLKQREASEINEGTRSSVEPRQSCADKLKEEVKSLTANILKVFSIPYVLTFLAAAVTVGSLNGYMALLLDILRWKELTDSNALLAFPVTYGTGLAARLLTGVVKQCSGFNSLILPIIYTIFGCAGQFVIVASSSLPIVLVGCGLTGISMSGVITASIIVVVQLVRQEDIAIGIGIISTAIGVSSAAFGPAFGAIRDSSGSYGLVLKLIIGCQLVGLLLFILTLIARKRSKSFNSPTDKQQENYGFDAMEDMTATEFK